MTIGPTPQLSLLSENHICHTAYLINLQKMLIFETYFGNTHGGQHVGRHECKLCMLRAFFAHSVYILRPYLPIYAMLWCSGYCREYWVTYRGSGFLAVELFGSYSPSPAHSPSHAIKLSLFLSLPVCRRSSLLTGDGGGREWVGEEPKISTPRESLSLYKSFNTLWCMVYAGPFWNANLREHLFCTYTGAHLSEHGAH